MDSQPFKHLPLARLCKEHRLFSGRTALADSLGDGALYERNEVFRQIRDAALAAGCQFTTDDAHGYFAWPLVQLPALLRSRVVPYRKTFAAVNALAEANPHFFTTAHAESLELQPNVVLHEAAHCIADGCWQMCAGGGDFGKDLSQLLRFTIAESFANTTELAAMAACQTTEDRWFLSFNSYWSWQEGISSAWRLVAKELEPSAPVRWVLACFLSANLQKKKLMPDLAPLHALMPTKYSPAVQAALRLLQDEAFNLNPVFRRDTFEMFFRSIGCDPQALLSMRLDGVFARGGVCSAIFNELVETLVIAA